MESLLQRLLLPLRRATRWTIIGFGWGAIALVSLLDWSAAAGIRFDFLYILPITAIGWFCGRSAGLVSAGLATVPMFAAELVFRPAEPRGALAWNAAEQFLFYSAAAYAVSLIGRQAQNLRILSREDPLTGILNRRAFFGALGRAIDWSRRHGGAWSLAFIDADNFKEVNDKYGHATGDRVLQAAARTLKESVRRIDAVARLGGDEFAILLREADPEQADAAIRKVDALLRVAMARSGWPVTFSIGVITFLEPPESADSAIALADGVMYRVKRAGKAGASTATWPA